MGRHAGGNPLTRLALPAPAVISATALAKRESQGVGLLSMSIGHTKGAWLYVDNEPKHCRQLSYHGRKC